MENSTESEIAGIAYAKWKGSDCACTISRWNNPKEVAGGDRRKYGLVYGKK